jgi:hypothetical protein
MIQFCNYFILFTGDRQLSAAGALIPLQFWQKRANHREHTWSWRDKNRATRASDLFAASANSGSTLSPPGLIEV